MQEVQRELAASGAVEKLRHSAAGNGGSEAAHLVLAGGDALSRIASEIQSLGVVVRDPATGLVDFPAMRDGEPVFLCWRVDEDSVGHWHDRDSGFMGRQPL